MHNGLKYALIFTLGAAVGSVVTWKLIETKYERIAQEEIDSVKEVFSRREATRDAEESEVVEPEVEEAVESDAIEDDTPNIRDYAAMLQRQNYTTYSDVASEDKEVDNIKEPYVISPDEFGEDDEYDTISYTYYADGVLTDDNDEIVEDIDAVVGRESLNHFGEYEDDSVFVRNERLKCDYEILLDSRKYTDVKFRNVTYPHDDVEE